MKQWKSRFRNVILERGYQCYMEDLVLGVDITEDAIHATVDGTEIYEVCIHLDQGEITDMECTCPYAEDGNACKHMAAVLFEVEENNSNAFQATQNRINTQEIQEELFAVTQSMNHEELKQCLCEIALQDLSISNQMICHYSKTITPPQLQLLKQELQMIYSDCSTYICFLLDQYEQKIVIYIDQRITPLIQRRLIPSALELSTMVFDQICKIHREEYEYISDTVVKMLTNNWHFMIQYANEQEKQEIFDWFKDGFLNNETYQMRKEFELFFFEEFQETEQLKEKANCIDQKLKHLSLHLLYQYGIHLTQVEELVIRKMKIMIQLKESNHKIDVFAKKYWDIPAIRKSRADLYLEQGEIDLAIDLLKKCKKLDHDLPSRVMEHSEKLQSIYLAHERIEEYKVELKEYLETWKPSDLTFVLKLKEVCQLEEWEEYRENYLSKHQGESVYFELLEHEQLYERLLRAVVGEHSLELLNQYESTLKQHYQKEIRNAYVDYVCKEAEYTSTRDTYRELAKVLNKVKKYSGGKEVVQEIVTEWQELYRNRPAMMDELRRAGLIETNRRYFR